MNQRCGEQIGEPELARLSVFQSRYLRLQFSVSQRQLRWTANPVTLAVRRNTMERITRGETQVSGHFYLASQNPILNI